MNYDSLGRGYVSQAELMSLLYLDPDLKLENFLVSDPETFNRSLSHFYADLPKLQTYVPLGEGVNIPEFDAKNQNTWFMPAEYLDMDIAAWVLDQCKTPEELQRVGQELIMYQERDLFNLLRFLKYLVDTLRQHNIVWGVGRGSSVASYVLYLIGVHRINSMYYDLDIAEFLK